MSGSLLSTQLTDTNGDGFNDKAVFLFTAMNYTNGANALNDAIIAVVEATIISSNAGNVNGTIISPNMTYQYALESLFSSISLIVVEPSLSVVATSVETINTIAYQVLADSKLIIN